MSAPRFSPEETCSSAVLRLAEALQSAGIEEPSREARLLLCAALDVPMARLVAYPETPLGEHAARLGLWAARRLRREPLSRIRGSREFYGRNFVTSAAVLDPRPETEILVETALQRLKEAGLAAPRILDLGTGSGAIIISLLIEKPEAKGIAVDLSVEALRVAVRNAASLGVADRLTPFEGDLFSPVSGMFDLIISNPPYIPSADLSGLEPEVRDFDPALALDGGADGLSFYRRIIAEAPRHLVEGGLLGLELGIHQARAVRFLAEQAGFGDIRIHFDLSGIERHLTAQWKKA